MNVKISMNVTCMMTCVLKKVKFVRIQRGHLNVFVILDMNNLALVRLVSISMNAQAGFPNPSNEIFFLSCLS